MTQTEPTVVFVLSTTRSGSTWLALMLGSNSRAAYVGELKEMYGDEPTPCSLCDERGETCELFHDVADVRPRSVHALLAERSGRHVLVDNSKTRSWSRKHLRAQGIRRAYIHLLRDPRAVVYSWRTRNRPKGHARWMKKNYQLREFLEANGLDFRLITYNDLAERTDETMTSLSEWLGLVYEPEQKEYWRFEHHGCGRNGATAAFLEQFDTVDRSFYGEMRRKQFHDLRWRDALPLDQQRLIEHDPKMRTFLSEFGLRLTDTGLERTGAPANA